jgi:hypothetical protein
MEIKKCRTMILNMIKISSQNSNSVPKALFLDMETSIVLWHKHKLLDMTTLNGGMATYVSLRKFSVKHICLSFTI